MYGKKQDYSLESTELLMSAHLFDWLSLALRWSHIVAAIAWIGSSLYFMWLDAALERPAIGTDPSLEGSLWMVHSGGFYRVERRKIGPGAMPSKLHWFKYEALLTWLTGMCLVALIYYGRAELYLIDPARMGWTPSQAILVSLGFLMGAWVVYDGVWNSKLAERSPRALTALSIALVGVLGAVLCHIYSGRGAYIHLGAILGTIMVLNVWVRILPAQQKMVDATAEGKVPDLTNSTKAKHRSVHNSYVTLPVLFTMISQHYPMTLGNERNAAVLFGIVLTGIVVRHAMIAITYGRSARVALATAAVLVGALFVVTMPKGSVASRDVTPVQFSVIRGLVDKHCSSCHTLHPHDAGWPFPDPPQGLSFDQDQTIKDFAMGIKERVADTRIMPLGNKTGITEDERDTFRRWALDLQKPTP